MADDTNLVRVLPEFQITCASALSGFFSPNSNNFSLFGCNVQSIYSHRKFEMLQSLLDSCSVQFDLLALTETWFTHNSLVHTLDGYVSHSITRDNKRGGGVTIYVKEAINAIEVDQFSMCTSDFESVCLTFNSIVLLSIYRPPTGDNDLFHRYLCSFLDYASRSKLSVIVTGDFNYNFLRSDNNISELFATYGCDQIISSGTRPLSADNPLLDPVFTDLISHTIRSAVLQDCIGDHLPTVVQFERSLIRNKGKKLFGRSYSDANSEKFLRLLNQQDWSSVYSAMTVDTAYQSFLDMYSKCYNLAFPLHELKSGSKRIRKPYITKELLERMKIRNKMYQRFNRSRSDEDYEAFKKYRNELQRDIEKSRKQFEFSRFPDYLDPRRMWQRIATIANFKSASPHPASIRKGEQLLTGSELCNFFNEYFVNVTKDLEIDPSPAFSFYDKPVNSALAMHCFNDVTPLDVQNYIGKLSNSSSCGYDSISSRSVKLATAVISDFLAHVINLMFHACTFPSQLKLAKVIVLYKKGDKNVAGNYRPISLLPTFSKIFERAIYDQLYRFVATSLSPRQFGFRKQLSTEMALLTLKDDILTSIDQNYFSIGIAVDFCKAFDCASHDVIFHKLANYGVQTKALQLLRSYLAKRKQYVTIDHVISNTLEIKNGVPQGSILGPLLFLVLVNDLISFVRGSSDGNISVTQYADDHTMLVKAQNLDSVVSIAQNALDRLHLWCLSNRMAVNGKKTNAIVFGFKRLASLPVLKYGGEPLSFVENIKLLGVWFDSHLTFNKHVLELRRNLIWKIAMLHRIRNMLPQTIKYRIYLAHIHSVLTYCNLVWGTTSKVNINALFVLQKRAVRSISNVPYRTHTRLLFEQLGLTMFPSIYYVKLGLTLCHYKQNTYFYSLLKLQKPCELSQYSLRRINNFYAVPRTRIKLTDDLLNVIVPQLLNNLHARNIILYQLPISQVKTILRNLYVA
jgi:hypothetical protein